MNKTGTIATGYAFLAAALYALNAPLSKALLQVVSPAMMAALLYLGAGVGIGFSIWCDSARRSTSPASQNRKCRLCSA
ncbi:MAG: hypothetical protein R2912_10155 [Eubacteriales bacterium]